MIIFFCFCLYISINKHKMLFYIFFILVHYSIFLDDIQIFLIFFLLLSTASKMLWLMQLECYYLAASIQIMHREEV